MSIFSKMPFYLAFVFIFFVSNVNGGPQSPLATAKSSQKAFEFVEKAEAELSEAAKKAVEIEWNYATNITDENEKIKLDYTVSKIITYPLTFIYIYEDKTDSKQEIVENHQNHEFIL